MSPPATGSGGSGEVKGGNRLPKYGNVPLHFILSVGRFSTHAGFISIMILQMHADGPPGPKQVRKSRRVVATSWPRAVNASPYGCGRGV